MRRRKIILLFILTCFSNINFANASTCQDIDFQKYSDANKDFKKIFLDNTIQGTTSAPLDQRIAQLSMTKKAGKQSFDLFGSYGIWGTDEGVLIHLPNTYTVGEKNFPEGVTVNCYYDEAGRSVLTGKSNFIMAAWQP